MMEMVSRVRAVLRRAGARPQRVIENSEITIDEDKHEVRVYNDQIQLTLKEYELLSMLMRHPGIVFTRDQLLNDIWGSEYDGETRTIDVHIRTLRQKLGDAGRHIDTVRGVGYRYREDV